MKTAWVLLAIAGLLEVCWATGLKYTQGFTQLVPTVFTVGTLSLSMYLLAKATEQLPIGTAYAVWVGIGAAGTAVLGVALFGETLSVLRAFFLILLLASIIGLKLTAGDTSTG